MITPPYPEHEKLLAVVDYSQWCGEFLEWLQGEAGYVLAKPHFHQEHGCHQNCTPWDYDRLGKEPTGCEHCCGLTDGVLARQPITITKVLAQFFGIDLAVIEAEERLMLEELQLMLEELRRG